MAIEVRDLAQRSADATKNIKDLIDTGLKKVENGENLVRENSEKLIAIAAHIKQVADICGEITAAAKEQFSAVEQINLAMTQLDLATQQNAALVIEIASSSEDLANKSQSMGDLLKMHFQRTEKTIAPPTLKMIHDEDKAA